MDHIEPDMMEKQEPPPARVTVVDLDISFGNLMWLLVKVAIAAIPAAILLFICGTLAVSMLGGIVRL